jgi:zinc protease
MKKRNIFIACALMVSLVMQGIKIKEEDVFCLEPEESMTKSVHKFVLDNGMTILVRSVHTLPKVSIQLFYHVGSKDEGTGERGIAHFIEHLIFKGTSGKKSLNLSESDINMLSQILAAYTNAFTSYDYTGYLFNVPTQNWKKVLPVMADCMTNCAFKPDHINSEMKAVIQELKMGKDNYAHNLMYEMAGAIFSDHPYHHPIIGYKQDLWSIDSEGLRSFYKKHYKPNNATLVIVGDVDPEDVLQEANEVFGNLKPDHDYKKQKFYHNKDVAAKSITFYRDIQQPEVLLAYLVPGESAKKDEILDVINYILFAGKSSRLYKKLVDELQLVTSISAGHWALFEYGLFLIQFEPKNLQDVDVIIKHINDEIALIVKEGVLPKELESATKKARMQYYSLLENIQRQAYDIGKGFLATGDEEYVLRYLQEPSEELAHEIHHILANYFRASVTNKGLILPLPESERATWKHLQEESDEEDNRILTARARTSPVEEPIYARKIESAEQGEFHYPKPETFTMNNGIKVLYHNTDTTPKINLIVDLRAAEYYDPEDKQGLYGFVSRMLAEGTKKYTGEQLAEELESRGMSFSAYPGGMAMTMLSEDLEKGLELLEEILDNATFDKKAMEKIRLQILADLKSYWDDPKSFARQLVREQIYKGHPYAKNALGTKESIENITREDLIAFYKKYIRPDGAKIAVVGDLKGYNLKDVFKRTLGKWHGDAVEEMKFPAITPCEYSDYNYPINRDQVILSFAGLSIDRKDPDYDKCVLFDQIFSGRSLMSMHSRLFQLREQSGLFYSIGGSLVAQSNEQPGMVQITTMVSLDRLAEAEKAIKDTLDSVLNTIEAPELDLARNAIITSLINNFESNYGIANTFLFLEKYGFDYDYFDKRNEQYKAITLDEMKEAVQRILEKAPLTTFRIGRVDQMKKKRIEKQD